ncbi:MAG: DNA ligase D, partial [Sphingobacteriales bacterium]
VPKGISIDPSKKRLAMMVEDHPFDYKDFEGIIPEGNYGAGTVIIWDRGTYEPVGISGADKSETEKFIRSRLHKGELKLRLYGEKARGEFVLVRSRDKDNENAWLLYKTVDEFSETADITALDRSVVSGRTIEEVAKSPGKTWVSNRKAAKPKKVTMGKIAGHPDKRLQSLLGEGKKQKFPDTVSPMLATLGDEAFDDPNWLYEIKWDGYRTLASLRGGVASLTSRKNITLNKFQPIVAALSGFPDDMILDGELVVLDEEGHADFQLLQSWAREQRGFLCYQVFDILWYKGYDLTALPLIKRKKILEQVLPASESVRYCDHVEATGKDFYRLAERWGIEGIIAKKKQSAYLQGARSRDWLKIKNQHFMEAVITGFTAGRNSRKYIGALILGQYVAGELRYIGHSGSGMDDKTIRSVYQKLQSLVIPATPFAVKPVTNMPATWVRPELVCEIKYQEMTREGILRIPIFQGIRSDKTAKELQEESLVNAKKSSASPADTPVAPTGEIAGEMADKKQATIYINGKGLALTNLDKLYWPTEGISKRRMLQYYEDVMPYMLAYMRNRPQSLNRFPNGVEGKSFYQKDVRGKVPEWIKTFPYTSENTGGKKDFLVCTDEASLLYIANLGCIEMNPWHSRIEKPAFPDWCVVDLDPDDIHFDKVVITAQVVKKVLDAAGASSFVKTSGSTGLHIYIPLGGHYTYDQSRIFAEIIANLVHHELPEFTSVERNPAKRRGKIYIDYLQNRNIQTIAAPYSLRPKPGATASAPLHWSEVRKGLAISQFHIDNMKDRIRNEGDLFTGVMGEGIDLDRVLMKLLELNEAF